MRAVLCKQYGPPDGLVLGDIPAPTPGPGEVLIAIKASSVNFPDVLMIEGKYQRKPEFPFSPGGEVAGTIKALGPGATGFNVGDRVMAFVGNGGFAEEVAVPTTSVMAVPPAMGFNEAASFLMTYGTVHYGLTERGHVKAGETLLVLGAAGGIGIAAVEVGKLLGAAVIAAASSDDKVAFCRSRGADHGINYTREDFRARLSEITAGKGVDVVCDPVGGALSEQALRSTAWDGRFLVVGFAAGEIPRVPLNLPLLKGCSIVGVSWGAFLRRGGPAAAASWAHLAKVAATGKLVPTVTETYPLERAADAILALKERRAKSKIVVVP